MADSRMRFTDKVAVVIGGNSGIGLAAAKLFAQEGARVAIAGRDARKLEAAASEIGAGTHARQCDIARLEAIDAFMQAVKERFGRIDALVINAGVGTFAPVRQITPELWDQVHAVNLRGCFFAAQKALPLMQRGSAIVFTGSIGAVLGIPGNAVYAAAKAGLRAAARILATELVGEGIRVNVVSPGPTETPLLYRNQGMDDAAVEGLRRQMIANVPMHRMGEPEEVARAILFLASHEASFITGVDLFVDGGCVEL